MNNLKKIIILFFFIIIVKNIFYNKKKTNKEIYDILLKNYRNIFPDNNRNSGGAQYFEYIVNKIKPTSYEFNILNKFFCPVSGSLISYQRKNTSNKVKIKDLNDHFICGDYYRCCIPCNCDIMRCARVEKLKIKLKDGTFIYDVLTINDPCKNENLIPDEVTSFKCENNKTKNAIHTKSGRIVIGLLFNAKKCSQKEIDSIDSSEITGNYCKKRNSQNPEELKGGMGDIFVKLCSI